MSLSHPARWIALGVGVVMVLLSVVLAVSISRRPSQASMPRLVQQHAAAPDFTLRDLSTGKTITSTSLKNKTVVVNFFNSWCIPCQLEEPALQAFYAEHRTEPDFAMVGIIIDDDAPTMRNYVAKKGIDWPVGIDPNGKASVDFGTTGQPETYVIAPDGVAVCGALGPSTQAALDVWLAAARNGQECT